MRRLFGQLFRRGQPPPVKKSARPPKGAYGPSNPAEETRAQIAQSASADNAFLEEYAEKKRRYGVVSGVWYVPTSPSGAVRLIAPGVDRVIKLLTITPNGSNSGTIYLSAGGSANANTGFPLTKTSNPLVLRDVLLGDISVVGTNSGDSITWIGSGSPEED